MKTSPMARRRFFFSHVRNGQAELEGDEARHLTQVLRVEAGQVYEISDNENVYLAEVDAARKQHVVFRVLDRLPAEEPPVPVTLLLSLIKFERLETLIEKAAELGVTEIRLVKAERSEKGLDLAAPKRMQRWERIALEARQQSRRVKLPVLLFLDEERNGANMLEAVKQPGPAAVLVGPEGGWPDHERAAALAAGWTAVSLGPNVLRTETAAIAALAVLNSILYLKK
jgi:16S rRNA (uracil1498-N3)-methyltransferase